MEAREEESMKFVEFDQFCKSCKHWNVKETEEPCNSCLEVTARPGTTKPEKYDANN